MMRLILHVPALEHLPGGPAQLPSRFAFLLTRARRFETDNPLAAALGRDPLPAAGPLAALGACEAPEPAAGQTWIRFDPLRLIPDLAAVWVDRPLPLDLTAAGVRTLREAIDDMLAAEVLEWRIGDAGFGLARLDGPSGCEFTPAEAAAGRRLDEVLPRGDGSRRWVRLINESQMLFHQFRTLDRGDQQGAGLWFWGEGAVPAGPGPEDSLTIVDPAGGVTTRGLARWLGAAYETAPGWRAADGSCLAHLPLERTDPGTTLSAIETGWIAPALEAMRRGRLDEVVVVGERGLWRIRRRSLLAAWRRVVQGFSRPSGSAA